MTATLEPPPARSRARSRRLLSVLALVVGLVLVATAVVLFVTRDTKSDFGTATAVPAATTEAPPPPTSSSPSPTPPPPPPPAITPARLAIPHLGIDAPVVEVAVDTKGALGVPPNPQTLGWWNGGAKPGSPTGSAVLDGHVDSAKLGRGAFYDLINMKEGDAITVTSETGQVLKYAVTARKTYDKKALPPEEVFSQDGPGRLVLITCGGTFDSTTGHYLSNVVVYASPVLDS